MIGDIWLCGTIYYIDLNGVSSFDNWVFGVYPYSGLPADTNNLSGTIRDYALPEYSILVGNLVTILNGIKHET
jgi:hypothetical protein